MQNSISNIVSNLKLNYSRDMTRSLAYRQRQLSGLKHFITECEAKIIAALHADLGKSAAESLATELGLVAAELRFTQKRLSSWIKPKRVSSTLAVLPATSLIYPEPRGVVLIIAPWNYPINLTLIPLIGALAAGNCVVLKPSELAPATSHLLATELPKYIDKACLSIVEGAVLETTALLNEKFDYIFYTGNGTVGQIVMTAAAKHLTPVSLELGGKSPCIVDETTNLDVAARRIIWGKFTNAGQTCVAPDYVLVLASIENKLLSKMKEVLLDFYGNDPKKCPEYGRIINTKHYQRLMNLLSDSGDIDVGGYGSENERYIAPTILRNVPTDAPVMAGEIFGPILPVIKIHNIEEAIAFINARPKPLSLYLFSSKKETRQRVITKTSSGGVGIDCPMMHFAVPTLPFGGVGASGIGAYHGKATFDTFTHYKSVLIKPTWFDPSILYPPYSSKFMRLIRWLMFS